MLLWQLAEVKYFIWVLFYSILGILFHLIYLVNFISGKVCFIYYIYTFMVLLLVKR